MWLKKFENECFGVLILKKFVRWYAYFHFVQFEIGAQIRLARFGGVERHRPEVRRSYGIIFESDNCNYSDVVSLG